MLHILRGRRRGRRRPAGQAALRSPSSWRSKPEIRFQLAKMRLTSLRSPTASFGWLRQLARVIFTRRLSAEARSAKADLTLAMSFGWQARQASVSDRCRQAKVVRRGRRRFPRESRSEGGPAHHSFISTLGPRQVVEKWCRCGGSIESISVERDPFRKDNCCSRCL